MRAHHWSVDFQIPLDLPGGTYRLVARGDHWDADAPEPYEVASGAFKIIASDADTLVATLEDGTLTLAWTHAPHAFTTEGPSPTAGYRLLDPTVPPNEPATVRAPLTIDFTANDQSVGDYYDVTFTAGQGHVFDYAATGLPTANLKVRARLQTDSIPVFVEADVTVKP
jgi:hypothetical protein